VNGYVGALHKSFSTLQEAEQYMNGVSASASGPAMLQSSPKRPLPFSAPGKVRRPFFVNTEVYLGHVRINKAVSFKSKASRHCQCFNTEAFGRRCLFLSVWIFACG